MFAVPCLLGSYYEIVVVHVIYLPISFKVTSLERGIVPMPIDIAFDMRFQIDKRKIP